MSIVGRLLRDERGATAIEYGLILALISMGIITAAQGMGDQLASTFSTASSGLANP